MKRILLLYFVFTLTAMAQTELISSFDSTGTDSGFWQTFIISEGDERIYTTLHSDTSSGSRLIPSLEYEDKIEGNAAMKIDYGVISTWTYPRTGGDVALHHTLGDNELYDFSMFDTLSISLKVLSSNPFYTEDVTSNDIELFLILFDVSNTDDYQVDGFNSEIEYYSCRIYTINSPDTDWQVIKIPLENTSDYYSSSGFALAQDFLLDRGIVGNGVLDKDKIRGFALEFHLVSFPGIQQQLIEGELLIDNFYAFGNSALPVELISFTCASNQNNIRLDWRTNMEIDNYGFEVQRDNSIMEDNTKVGWKSIGFLEGKGNTTEPQTYSFVDTEPTPGINKYRLKQLDFDGNFEYSKTIEIEVDVDFEFQLIQNYPNPFNPSTNIDFSLPQSSYVTISIYNSLGEQIKVLTESFMEAGKHSVQFNSDGLPSGIYLYEITVDNYHDIKKMILLR